MQSTEQESYSVRSLEVSSVGLGGPSSVLSKPNRFGLTYGGSVFWTRGVLCDCTFSVNRALAFAQREQSLNAHIINFG